MARNDVKFLAYTYKDTFFSFRSFIKHRFVQLILGNNNANIEFRDELKRKMKVSSYVLYYGLYLIHTDKEEVEG